ncbi:N-6 DNA methylase [Burkholderia pyrrocinia]|nr:N-6 DNA methylase [Burkholderia pyrrocinia]EKS9893601.1 N-6 DNA methylase [Burkholderia pyrrocinia]EKS9905773.1 N-6 DNA methylase [Burkholderia pyrrocinia]
MKSQATQELTHKLEQLLEFLGYTPDNGWMSADRFGTASLHRFALTQARDLMGIAGVFSWFSGAGSSDVAVPLVYIAIAADEHEAKAIHRKVWSQGLVPFLVVVTREGLVLCPGFQYDSSNWRDTVTSVDWSILASPVGPMEDGDNSKVRAISYLRAVRLRSSIFWHDYALETSGRVDQVLLSGLTDLSYSLISGTGVSRRLPHTAANGLIGKLLYLYCLVDRGVISQRWLQSRGHTDIELTNVHVSWSESSFWALLDDLDSIFNGSVFPIGGRDRTRIDASHIQLARAVIRHGAKVLPTGAVQLSFLDIDLGVLRVETLSAVYEQFLENVQSGERRRVGAYYTPPFLVDLVLDRVEADMPLKDGVTVLDPSAGSGVFLVGAYRRILEHAWGDGSTALSLDRVRNLLTQNIFGVERNVDACHVAAFSLYLTMLDYVNPRDLDMVAANRDSQKLFPALLGSNLFADDFFSTAIASSLPGIRCVIGNPPWQTLEKLESKPARTWADTHADCPIGKDQAAELFIWKALRTHLVEDGVLAVLIPAKSFVNPTAARFRNQLQAQAYVRGAINLSHLRHKLFSGAKHACAALFVRNRKATYTDRTWVYTPLSITQPLSRRDGGPWTLIIDQASVHEFSHDTLAASPRGWFDAFVLSRVDRQIQQYINDATHAGSILRLERLCDIVGAKYKRGGNASDTGLPSAMLYGAEKEHDGADGVGGQALTRDLFGPIEVRPDARRSGELPTKLLPNVKASYRSQFSGNILLVPRNFRRIGFVSFPLAFNSSHLAVFFDKDGFVTPKEKRFLCALGAYLRSNVALYFLATTGRRWLMDRSNVEPADLGNLPVPFASLDDERIDQILRLDEDHVDDFVFEALGLDHDLRRAVVEFLKFRLGFQDGAVPDNARTQVQAPALAEYVDIFGRSLDESVGRQGAFQIAHLENSEAGLGVVVGRYLEEDTASSAEDLMAICREMISDNQQHRYNSFANSAVIDIQSDAATFSLIKPLEYFRWTIDSAYVDSYRVMGALLTETV